MAKFKNSFALLDDEEGDDVTTLVDRIVKKVDNTLTHAQDLTQSSDYVQEESGHRSGGRGSRDGSRGNGYGWDDSIQGGDGWDGHRRNYSRDSYGSGDTVKNDGGWDGDSRGRGRGLDGGNGWNNVNEAAGGDMGQTENNEPGWLDVSKSNGKKHANHSRSTEDGHRRFRNGNQSYSGGRRGYWDEAHDNGAADGQRRYRNGNQGYDGRRRGYGDQPHYNNGAADGRWRYNNGRWYSDHGDTTSHGDQVQDRDAAADGQRRFQNWRVNGYQVQDNGAGSEQLDVNGEVIEDNKFKDEERTYRNGKQNYRGERSGYGTRYRGKGRQEYQWTSNGEVKESTFAHDGHDVKDEYVNISEGSGAVVLEAALKAAETEVQNTYEEVNGGNRDPEKADSLKKEEMEKKKKEEDKKKEGLEKKKEEDKEPALMTLAEYEKLLLEKRQALEALKAEERKVSLDKELEEMRLIEKKQEDIDDKQKSEVKLKKKGSLENKEKGCKLVGLEVQEIFKPVSRHRTNGARGGGRGGRGRGGQGGFSGQTNYYHGPRTYQDARAHQRAPTDKDFPVLGTNPPPVKP